MSLAEELVRQTSVEIDDYLDYEMYDYSGDVKLLLRRVINETIDRCLEEVPACPCSLCSQVARRIRALKSEP